MPGTLYTGKYFYVPKGYLKAGEPLIAISQESMGDYPDPIY